MNDMNINNNLNINNIKNNEDKELRKVSNEFESFFVQKMLESGLKNTNLRGEERGSDIIKSMYIENISKTSSGTLGISNMLYEFLSKNK